MLLVHCQLASTFASSSCATPASISQLSSRFYHKMFCESNTPRILGVEPVPTLDLCRLDIETKNCTGAIVCAILKFCHNTLLGCHCWMLALRCILAGNIWVTVSARSLDSSPTYCFLIIWLTYAQSELFAATQNNICHEVNNISHNTNKTECMRSG